MIDFISALEQIKKGHKVFEEKKTENVKTKNKVGKVPTFMRLWRPQKMKL